MYEFKGAPLGRLVYDRTYSRDGEDWSDTVRRVVDGNLALVDEKYHEDGERERLYQLMLDRALIPAGRHLWMTGVEGRQFLANCFVAPWGDAARHHTFMFNELMKGGGVGANYSHHHLQDLPQVQSEVRVTFDGRKPWSWTVPDSREGWVEALQFVLGVATSPGDVGHLDFDVSQIRPAGTPIRTFGGIAAGSGPLVKLLTDVADILNSMNGQPWTAAESMAIDHAIAEAVVSGNVRRSARMSIMYWDDPDIDWFLDCKARGGDHWSTNISVEIDQHFIDNCQVAGSKAQYVLDRIITGMLRNGEPGIFNSDLASEGESTLVDCTNPCGEIALEPGEPCVLGHVNLAYPFEYDHDRNNAFRLMARFLMRATFMDVEDSLTEEVIGRNRRIGVGFFGLQEFLSLRGQVYSQAHNSPLAKDLFKWKHVVRRAADQYADQLDVPRPVKTTTVAPTGTIGLLAGTTTGIQPIYARYYIRRVRYADNDPALVDLRRQGVVFEKDLYSDNTVVALFPTKDAVVERVGENIQQADEILPDQALGLQACVQRWYADNAISHTINVDPTMHPWVLKSAIIQYLGEVKGITVFPDLGREQAPYERITREEYEDMVGGGVGQADIECVGASCPVR